MSEWVSQSEAVKLLAELGDRISQPALSQYLANHAEVPREDQGAGRPTLIDFAALRRSRETRAARGPAESPTAAAPEPTRADAPEAVVDQFSRRKASADVDRAEAEARRARVLADEAEGRVIARDVAVNAFMAAGVALTRAFEENRRTVIDEVRAAKDAREAALILRTYEKRVRRGFANALTDLADAADPALAAAQ